MFPTEWDYGFSVKDAVIEKISNTRIEGYAKCVSGTWSSWNDWTLYFSIRFSKPFDSFNGWKDTEIIENVGEISGSGEMGAYVTYKTADKEEILVQTGLSLVSMEGARLNLQEEVAEPFGWDFDACVNNARQTLE